MVDSKFVKSLISNELIAQEKKIFSKYTSKSSPVIFIVCAPRVGSTLLYQFLINNFGFTYFSNFINDYFSTCPAVGVAHQIISDDNHYLVSYKSQYGKTAGSRETSEASAIFGNWFGGEHPSELNSAKFISSDKKKHMQSTISAVFGLTGTPVIVKNPWNSFRIKSLSQAFPQAYFIWIRRDIEAAAISDLENRYKRGDPNKIWNSATTSNYLEIKKHPHWEQVVLQQYHYSLSIQNLLNSYADNRNIEIWYEDLCNSTELVTNQCENFFKKNKIPYHCNQIERELFKIKQSSGAKKLIPKEDVCKLSKFIDANISTFDNFQYCYNKNSI